MFHGLKAIEIIEKVVAGNDNHLEIKSSLK